MVQEVRDTNAPYPLAQAIFNRMKVDSKSEMWGDLYKKDLIKVFSARSHRTLHHIKGSPYLEALLKRGLKRRESWETTDPILEEAMMYMTVIGTELCIDDANMMERVDLLSLEM